MGFTGTGVQWWDDTDGPYVNLASQEMATSLDPLVNASFPSVAARNSAYSGMIAAGKKGMACYVENYGRCYYDGNLRTSSAGWTWMAEHTLLSRNYPLSVHIIASDVILTVSPALVLTSPRNILTQVSCTYRSDDGSPPITSGAPGVTFFSTIQSTGMSMTLYMYSNQSYPGGLGQNSGFQQVVRRAPAGVTQVTWYLLQPTGGDATHGGTILDGDLSIYDLGPAD
jgi:hypothetical protein